MTSDVIINGGTLVSSGFPQGAWENGSIRVHEGIIREVACEKINNPGERASIIDASGKLILPGLINMHTHLYQSAFHSTMKGRDLIQWLREVLYPLETQMTPEDVYYNSLSGCRDMLLRGITLSVSQETPRHTDAAIQAVIESGMRGAVGCFVADREEFLPKALCESPTQALSRVVALKEAYRKASRVHLGLAPRFAPACSTLMYRALSEYMHDSESLLPIQTHAAETPLENDLTARIHGCSGIAVLNNFELLNRAIIAHGVFLSEEDVLLLSLSACTVVACPSSNANFSGRIAPIEYLASQGLTTTLGTDAYPVGLQQEAYLANMLHRSIFGTCIEAALQLEAVTLKAAKALGLDHQLGSISAGKRADLVIIDPRSHATNSLSPRNRACAQISDGCADTVLVDGKVLVSGGVCSVPQPPSSWRQKLARSIEKL